MTVRGESLGGGKVRIVGINGVAVDFSGEYNALIVVQRDKPAWWHTSPRSSVSGA